MTVAGLLARAGITAAGSAVESHVLDAPVSGIFYDSRRVAAGGVFVAVPGERFDGARFVADAGGRGAVLAVGQAEEPAVATVPWLRVPDARAALASLAAAFHGDPSHDLLVVGVTGTNGKTTTTYLIESMLEQAGMTAGRISSISSRIGRGHGEQPASRTTPEAPDVQALLGKMRGHGQRACVLEVSSHALALRRVDRVRFAAGVFTNLTRDHLDFHGDMARYYAPKRRLFEMLPERAPAILNVDDPHGARLAGSVRRPVTYALHRSADVVADRLDLGGDGVRMEVRTPRGTLHLQSSLLGRANACNLLAAAAAGVALDIPFQNIEEGLRSVDGVPGRLQTVFESPRRRHGHRRLRPYRRRLAARARDGPPARARPCHHGVRVRRRSRCRQAAADGRRRGVAQRLRGHNLRQPALGGSACDHRRRGAWSGAIADAAPVDCGS